MYQYITHGIIAFLEFEETNLGEFKPDSVAAVGAILTDVVQTGHQNEAQILIALGGANDYGFLTLMTFLGNNPAAPLLDKTVQNVVNFVTSNNLDGVDLDLECWWGKNPDEAQGGRLTKDGPHPAGSGLTLFAKKLREAMPGKLISAAIFGTDYYGNNYDSKLAEYLDWLGIMSYDFTGSWNASPVGPHTALYKIRNQESYLEEQQGGWPGGTDNPMKNNPINSVEDSLWYWTNSHFVGWYGAGQKIARNKMAAGVPIYGYDFAYEKDPDAQSGQVPPGYKVMRYKDILAQFPDANTAANGNIKVSGSTPRPPFISASGNYPYAHNIYFETPDTAVTKLDFLKRIGAQGVIIWELSNDVWEEGKSIIKALYQNSGNKKETRIKYTALALLSSKVGVKAGGSFGGVTRSIVTMGADFAKDLGSDIFKDMVKSLFGLTEDGLSKEDIEEIMKEQHIKEGIEKLDALSRRFEGYNGMNVQAPTDLSLMTKDVNELMRIFLVKKRDESSESRSSDWKTFQPYLLSQALDINIRLESYRYNKEHVRNSKNDRLNLDELVKTIDNYVKELDDNVNKYNDYEGRFTSLECDARLGGRITDEDRPLLYYCYYTDPDGEKHFGTQSEDEDYARTTAEAAFEKQKCGLRTQLLGKEYENIKQGWILTKTNLKEHLEKLGDSIG